MLKFKTVHDSLEERGNILKSQFSRGVLPVFGISCSDGVLLVGFSGERRFKKIRRLLDRVVFMGVGNKTYCNEVHENISADINTQSYMILSPGDMRAVDHAIESISKEMIERFRDLYSARYIDCEFLIAKVDINQEDDQLMTIDFAGLVSESDFFSMIPSPRVYRDSIDPKNDNNTRTKRIVDSVKDIETKLGGGLLMNQALEIFSENFQWLWSDKNVFVEVATLSRSMVRDKKFRDVYRRLSEEEINKFFRKRAE